MTINYHTLWIKNCDPSIEIIGRSKEEVTSVVDYYVRKGTLSLQHLAKNRVEGFSEQVVIATKPTILDEDAFSTSFRTLIATGDLFKKIDIGEQCVVALSPGMYDIWKADVEHHKKNNGIYRRADLFKWTRGIDDVVYVPKNINRAILEYPWGDLEGLMEEHRERLVDIEDEHRNKKHEAKWN